MLRSLVGSEMCIRDRCCGPGDLFGLEASGQGGLTPRRHGTAIALEDVDVAGLDRSTVLRVFRSQVMEETEAMCSRFRKLTTGHLRGFFDGWEFTQEVDGVRIYRKDSKQGLEDTQGVAIFKGVGCIDKPHHEVAAYLFGFENRVDWDPMFMGGTEIERLDGSTSIRHDRFYTPSPVHLNRDFVLLVSIRHDDELGEHTAVWSSVNSLKVPSQDGYVRGECSNSGFLVKRNPDRPGDSSQVTFVNTVDLKGLYPGWLADRVSKEQASFIRNIRKAMTRVITQPRMKTLLLDKGMYATIRTRCHDQQLDLWCFNHCNLNEVMNLYRTRRTNKNIIPVEGDYLFSNLGNKMLLVAEDSYSEHNTFTNSNHKYRPYTESDAEEVHMGCCDSLHEQLMTDGLCPPWIPLPWPLFCDVTSQGIQYTCRRSSAAAGEVIKLKALMNVVVVVSSCGLNTDDESADASMIDLSSSLKHYK
eukprot:TRINITY_DN28190_c0_g1_i2.p1 TRINITY_DN28190_c0_g1~~TRINITY_DN28190_c0_g1_i2.p1  ORF type:complete len:472 (-),score=101.84 TRINITY_DN28190_c0_g1_i2:428-1843(-)